MSGNDAAQRAEPGRTAPAGGKRAGVLNLLRDAPSPWSTDEIATRLRMHRNTVRFHLAALVENGQVERLAGHRAGAGRPPLRFRVVAGMDPGGPRNFRLLAGIMASGLVASPDPVGLATEAGRNWGGQLVGSARAGPPTKAQSLDRLMGLLDDLDFAPERRAGPDGEQVGLRHCPFLELAEGNGRVVCRAHLGLMQGAMTAMDAPVTVDTLDPFVEPNLCVAHLGPARPSTAKTVATATAADR